MNSVALGLAAIGAVLGIWLLYRPDPRVRAGFYTAVFGCIAVRIAMGRLQGMQVNWLDVVMAASFAVGVVLEVASMLKRKREEE